MFDKIIDLFRKESADKVNIKWLSEEERKDIKQKERSIKGDSVFYMPGGESVYQEKQFGFLYASESDLKIQYELNERLTQKGLFPPGTEWFGYKSEEKFGLASIMPHCVDSPDVKKPYVHESDGSWTPEIYQEVLLRIDPTIDIFTKKGEKGYENGKFWFELLTCDAWRSDNWREYKGKVYLVDFEGVSTVKDEIDRPLIMNALKRLRSLEPKKAVRN